MTFDVTTALIFGPAGVAAGGVASWLIKFGMDRKTNEYRDQAIRDFKADLAEKERLLMRFYEKLGILTGEHKTMHRRSVTVATEDSVVDELPKPPGKTPR